MRILALDLGATTGWAVIVGNKVRWHGQVLFKGDRAQRFVTFRDWLIYHITGWCGVVENGIDVNGCGKACLIFERPFSRGLAATRSLWGMAGIAEEVALDEYKVACLDIVPSTIKKWATGNGRASKDNMIVAAEALIHYSVPEPLGEHEADAIILGLYAAENIEPGD